MWPLLEPVIGSHANSHTDASSPEVNGSNGSTYDGAMYFPKGLVSFTGSSRAMTKCAMVVANRVDFSGNANLQNDVTGCSANKTVPGKVIRLVA